MKTISFHLLLATAGLLLLALLLLEPLPASSPAPAPEGPPGPWAPPAQVQVGEELGSPGPVPVQVPELPPPVAFEQVAEGSGEPLAAGHPFRCTCRLWEGGFERFPLTPQPLVVEGVCGASPYPGLARVLPGMRPGGTRRMSIEVNDFFAPGKLASSRMPTQGMIHVEVSLEEVYPLEELSIRVERPGAGAARVADGDVIRYHATAWSDRLDGERRFEATPESGQPHVGGVGESSIPGLDLGLLGMQVGEVRVLSIPWYLGLVSTARPGVPPHARLHYRVELLDILQPGEVQVTTVQAGTGSRTATTGDHVVIAFTGWLDGFRGQRWFDASRFRNQPFGFRIGGEALRREFWHQAVLGMRAGEVRHVEVPYNRGYGLEAWPPGTRSEISPFHVPPGSTLYYEVTLVEFRDPGELRIETVQEGEGPPARPGDQVHIHITGWLDRVGGERTFVTSREGEAPRPLTFTLGEGKMMPGLERVVEGMRVGERREAQVPFDLAYGAQGDMPRIPPFATLHLELERVAGEGQ